MATTKLYRVGLDEDDINRPEKKRWHINTPVGTHPDMTSTWTGYAMVAIGGAFGAMARMGVGHLVRSLAGGHFPWHTFAINISGSLALGFIATWLGIRAMPGTAALNHLLAIGFLGAYTTFSTFELETWNLVTEGRWAVAAIYVIASVSAGFAGLAAGVVLGRALT